MEAAVEAALEAEVAEAQVSGVAAQISAGAAALVWAVAQVSAVVAAVFEQAGQVFAAAEGAQFAVPDRRFAEELVRRFSVDPQFVVEAQSVVHQAPGRALDHRPERLVEFVANSCDRVSHERARRSIGPRFPAGPII